MQETEKMKETEKERVKKNLNNKKQQETWKQSSVNSTFRKYLSNSTLSGRGSTKYYEFSPYREENTTRHRYKDQLVNAV
jgi:hypothetical protein